MLESTVSFATRFRLAAVIFAMTYPSLLTWIYFTALNDASGPWQRGAFVVGKLIQFSHLLNTWDSPWPSALLNLPPVM
jgi:hypothetical protein